MESSKHRMMAVAVMVCGFAIGMAGLLNYFKYRDTVERIVRDRLAAVGSPIDLSIQSSLAVGLQLADLGTLPEVLQRQRATDDLIVGIEVFDREGTILYSTDRGRIGQPVPGGWLPVAGRAGNGNWSAGEGADAVIGIPVQTAFGLTVGQVALRYDDGRVRAGTLDVARRLALGAAAVFVLSSALATLALGRTMRDGAAAGGAGAA